MADYGLLAGIGEGLRSGLESYRQERDYQGKLAAAQKQAEDERRNREIERALKMKQLGIVQTGEEFEFTPEQERNRAMERAKDSAGLLRSGFKPVYDPTQKEFNLERLEGFLTPKEQQDKQEQRMLQKEQRLSTAQGLRAKELQAKSSARTASELRKEYISNPTVKDTQNVSVAFEKIKSAAQNPSAAGDLSLIFGFMKMLDPGSTVREGEFANAQNAGGIDDSILNMYNKARTGERLNPQQRADFIRQAEAIYNAQLDKQQMVSQEYTGLAQRAGVSPKDVVLFKQSPKTPGLIKTDTGPQIGEESDGYIFTGGDPSDQKNWRKK